MMVEFKLSNHTTITINASTILYFKVNSNRLMQPQNTTIIKLIDGEEITVTETYEEVTKKLT